MSLFNKKLLRYGMLSLAAFGVTLASVEAVRRVLGVDALHQFRTARGPETVGLQFKNVEFKHWKGDQLVTQAEVDQVDVRRDRQLFDLINIRNGMRIDEHGKVQFAGAHGQFDNTTRKLTVDGGVRVANADFDLQTDRITFDGRKSDFEAPGAIQGKLHEGDVRAVTLKFNSEKGTFEAGPVQWRGMLAVKMQDQDPEPPKSMWDIEGKSVSGSAGKRVYREGTATDGEILLKAPVLEHETRTDILTATGRVLYFSREADLVADKVVVYRQERRAVLTGNVQLLVKPKKDQEAKLQVVELPPFRPVVPDNVVARRHAPPRADETRQLEQNLRTAQNVRDYPLMIAAQQIEYWYGRGSGRAVITGSPQARQDLGNGAWRHVWADSARFDAEKEQLQLLTSGGEPSVRMKNSIGDDLIARMFMLSTRENDDSFEGEAVKGRVYADLEDDPRDRRNPPPQTRTDGT
jgi:lipopolysaccharide export system protein LptA